VIVYTVALSITLVPTLDQGQGKLLLEQLCWRHSIYLVERPFIVGV